jgi:hypothetical protein
MVPAVSCAARSLLWYTEQIALLDRETLIAGRWPSTDHQRAEWSECARRIASVLIGQGCLP